MKKLLTCLKLLVLLFVTSFSLQAQSGSLQATVTGSDLTNPIATINVGDITNNQPATSLFLTTNNTVASCQSANTWYFYDVLLNGIPELEEVCNVTDLDISTLVTDVASVVLVSVEGADDPSDGITDNITINMTLTAEWLGVGTDILTYGLLDPTSEVGPAVIDDENHTIVIDVANSYDETTSVTLFTLSPGATVSIAGVPQESGVTANDFTTPLIYTVTAANGDSEDWEVTMNVSETASDAKDMLTFNIAGFDGVIGANTIDVDITDPFLGLDITSLVPTFTSSDFSSVTITAVDQESGVTANDFSSTVIYTITAEDGTTKDYITTVTLSGVCGAQINVDLGLTDDESDQTFSIVPPLGETVTIDISNWNIDPGGWSDAVTIYNGPDATSPAIGPTYVGGEANPGTISSTSPTGALTIFVNVNEGSVASLQNNGTTFTADITCAPASTENDFVSFSIPQELGDAVIDTDAHTVDVEVTFGTIPSALTPSFESSTASSVAIAGVEQVSGVTENNYSGPVTYTITSQDGTTQDWIVAVSVAAGASDANDMLTFSDDGFDAVIGAGTIDLTISAFTTDVTALNPEFTSSPFSTVAVAGTDQTSGVTNNDFSSPVTYTVTAQDGSTQDWVVTVIIPSMCGETLAYDADILGNGVDETFVFTPDPGTAITLDFTSWGPDFNNWNDVVTIYDGPDTSAPIIGSYDVITDPNPGPITSTSFDGTITIFVNLGSNNSQTFFTADVSCTPASTENDFVSFSLTEELGAATIDTDAHTVAIETAFGTDITTLIPSFTTSPGSIVDIGGTDQESGVTTNNYSGPVTYTVTAQDGTTQDWIVTVSVAAGASTANDMVTFNINGVDGVIGAGTIDLEVSGFEPFVDALTPTFTSSPFSTVAIGGTDQVSGVDVIDFTSPVTYTVTAQDGSTQDWVVTVTIGSICGESFAYDADILGNGVDETFVFVPDPGTVVNLDFTSWGPDFNSWNDVVTIYDGPNTSSPVIGVYTGGEANPSPIVSTASNGSITIDVNLGSTNSQTFFAVDITCTAGSPDNDIVTFSIPEQTSDAVIDTDAHTIDIEVGFSIDLTDLTPEFTTTNASVNVGGVDQESGVTSNDFTGTVTYNVVAQDLTVQEWTVNIVNSVTAATGKDILTYNVIGVDATIGANTVDLDLDPFVNIADIIANFTLSPFATATISGVEQESGVTSNSFVVSTLTYTITAEDGTTKDYLVTVTKEDICGYNLDYPLGDVNYEIFEDETWLIAPDTPGDIVTISFNAFGTENCCDDLFVYEGSDATGTLLASLAGSALPGDISSADGLFLNFVSDLSVVNIGFDIDITCTTPDNNFLTFSLTDETGPATIDTDNHTVDIQVQLGTDPSALIPSFTVSPFATVDIGGTDQISGTTENPYTSPVTYTVTAANGTTQDWIVTVSVAASLSDESDFLSFNINGIDGTIDANAHTVDVEISPLDPDLTALVPTFAISPFSTVAIAAVDQISGTTSNDYTAAVTYTITAQDGSTQDWVVNVTVGSICGQTLAYDADILGNGVDETFVFTPDPGQAVNVDFSSWGPDFNNWNDVVTIYDGPDVSSPVIASYSGGEANPGTIVSTSPEGSLTIFVNLGSPNSQTFFTANVTCTDALSGTDIVAYTSDVALDNAVIDSENFTVTMEATFGTDVSSLVNDFTLSDGAAATIGGVLQVSGTTANDFTNPVIYTVTAQDGTTQDWTVVVNVAETASAANEILTFSIDGIDGVIGSGTIDLTVGAFDNVTDLTPSFTISPFSAITANGAPQISGFFSHDFSTPFTYVVTAQDGTTKDWIVTVTQPSMCDQTLAYDADILGNGVDETFLFTPTAGSVITLDFTSWGPDFNNWNDVITIYDGNDNTAPVIGIYSGGEANPGPITSTAVDGTITIEVDLGSTNSQSFFTVDVTCGTVDSSLDLTVLLEGPFDGGTGMMGTGLRDGSHIPLTDPYLASSTLDGTFFDPGNNLTVVDWVEIEVRQAATAAEADQTTIVQRFNGLLLSDASVVALDGSSNIILTGVTGDIFIVVNHRNHLSVMSSVAVSAVDALYTYDFTTSVAQAYGDGAADVGGVAVMHGGDVNGDGTVKYVGANNDSIIIFNLIDGNTNLNNTETGYYGSDVNLDGVAKYVGASNDDILIFNKIDGNTNLNNTVPTTTP